MGNCFRPPSRVKSTTLAVATHPGWPHNTFNESVQRILRTLNLTTADVDLREVPGGSTNQLFRADPDSLLVRVYGGAGLLDRKVEGAMFAALASWLGKPACLGHFANGRVETFLEGYETLTREAIATPVVAEAIAKALAHLHSFPPPKALVIPEFWETLEKWFALAADDPTCFASILNKAGGEGLNSVAAIQALLKSPALDFGAIRTAIERARQHVPSSAASRPLVMCHNDLLPANFMYNAPPGGKGTGHLAIIDLEYSMLNYPVGR